MLSDNLKKIRKLNHLTQKELAEKVDVAEITIRKYENGERKPSIEMVEKLATTLKVTPLDLLGYSNSLSSTDNMYINLNINNLISLSQSPDDSIRDLARTLEILIDNVASNTVNRYNVPESEFDNTKYINEINKLLYHISILVNPVLYINKPSYLNFINSIDEFIDFKLTKHHFAKED